jgi:hypothetical protein
MPHYVQMKMENFLPHAFAAIGRYSIGGQFFFLRYPLGNFKKSGYALAPGFLCKIVEGYKIPLGQKQNMRRRFRVDVVKRQKIFVLVNLFRWQQTVYYFAENIIFVIFSLHFKKNILSSFTRKIKNFRKMSNIFYRAGAVMKKGMADAMLLLCNLLLCLAIVLLAIFLKNNNVKKYNARLLEILASADSSRVSAMEELYRDKKIPQKSKTLVGMKLSWEYYRKKNPIGFLEINENILAREKDPVLKNIAGLNILFVRLNEPQLDAPRIEELFKKLENKKNPFLNVVREKKAIFLMKQGNRAAAEKIFDELLLEKTGNKATRDRIEDYKKIL